MNCEEYQQLISQFIDGELSQEKETDVFTHLGTCEQCRTFLKNVLSLRNTLSLTSPTAVPALLDQRILARYDSKDGLSAGTNIWQRYSKVRYSYRTIGLAVILSVFFTLLLSAFWHKSYESEQTIICLNPLPEVEVTGYIVNSQ